VVQVHSHVCDWHGNTSQYWKKIKETREFQRKIFENLKECEHERSKEHREMEARISAEVQAERDKENKFLISVIKPDMTKNEISETIGYPDYVSEQEGVDVWFYKEISGEGVSCRNVWVTFNDNHCINATTHDRVF
jgi:hypothetical protein